MYSWWVFIHLVGVFGFLIAHGVSIAVAFQLRTERDPRRISDLLQLSGSSMRAFYGSLLVLLISGVVAGFMGQWWSQAWIWTALGILVATSIAMYAVAKPYYRRVAFVARAMAGGSTAVEEGQFDAMLRSRRPIFISVIGFAGLLAILYLMMFKPSLGFGGARTSDASPGVRCEPRGTALDVTARNVAFETDCLAAPASRAFTITFRNEDPVPHNVAIYTNSSATEALFVGEIFPGPKTETYRVQPLDRGSYYFRCDVHPEMDGTFVVR